MAFPHFQRAFVDTAGNVRPGLSVTVRDESNGAKAALYSDRDGTVELANPLITDSNGEINFYTAMGEYRLIATGVDYRDVTLLTSTTLADAVGDAEQAAQVAAMNAGIYDDTAAGLAATSNGDYFSVPSVDSEGYLDLYRNDSGSATPVDTYPNKTAVDSIKDQTVRYFDSVAEMVAEPDLHVDQSVRTLGYYAPGDGGGNDYRIVAAGTGTDDGGSYIDLTGSGHQAEGLFPNRVVRFEQFGYPENENSKSNAIAYASSSNHFISLLSSPEIKIPSDANSAQIAINTTRPENGVDVIVRFEAGYSPSSGVYIENRDCSSYEIISDDSEVFLAAEFPDDDVFMRGVNSNLPKLSCLINAQSRGRGGYWATKGSSGVVSDGAGVKNIGNSGTETPKGIGCFVLENSDVNGSGTDGGTGCIFTGSATRNVWVSKNSDFQGESGNFDGCLGDHGVFISRESRSHLSLASVSNCLGNGLEMYRSYCTAPGAKFNNNGVKGASVDQGSRLSCPERNGVVTEFNGNGDGGIFARCSRVYAPRVEVIGNTGMGVQAIQVSDVDLDSSIVQDNTSNNVRSEDGSRVNINNGESTGSGADDLSIARAGQIFANGCTTTSSVGTPDIADCNIGAGFNTIVSNNGIIWD